MTEALFCLTASTTGTPLPKTGPTESPSAAKFDPTDAFQNMIVTNHRKFPRNVQYYEFTRITIPLAAEGAVFSPLRFCFFLRVYLVYY